MANSFQLDEHYTRMNEKDYLNFVKKMPSLPSFNTDVSPLEHARKVCKTLSSIDPIYYRSNYFNFWLHNLWVNKPIFHIDVIDDSVFGGEPNNPRLVQPRNHTLTKLDDSYDERQALYATGFDANIDTTEILEGARIVLRELYGILAKDRVMSIVTGKWSNVRIINDHTIEIEVHTVAVSMQQGIQQAIRNFFMKTSPRAVKTYHFGTEILEENIEKLAQQLAEEQ